MKRLNVGGIPDMRFINRQLPVADIARELGIRFGQNANLHCWHPERHEHGDRTASVGIRLVNNTVKCFSCDSKPIGPLDFVMDVLSLTRVAEAALWISSRFAVPTIPRGKHLVEKRREIWSFGHEGPLGLLIHSGLWARLSEATRSIAPVLVEMGERHQEDGTLLVTLSYRGITRYSGIDSPNSISKALKELAEIGWLRRISGKQRSPDLRFPTGAYRISPSADELKEQADACYIQHRQEIDAEKEFRSSMKRQAKADMKVGRRPCLLSKDSLFVE